MSNWQEASLFHAGFLIRSLFDPEIKVKYSREISVNYQLITQHTILEDIIIPL
jgi:hypothetical protein